jgi:hypothetical protein
MKKGLTTREEIADLIFNSEDPELNDMILAAKKRNYEISHLVWKIMADINGYFSGHLSITAGAERKAFLLEKIKTELAYFAHSYKKGHE